MISTCLVFNFFYWYGVGEYFMMVGGTFNFYFIRLPTFVDFKRNRMWGMKGVGCLIETRNSWRTKLNLINQSVGRNRHSVFQNLDSNLRAKNIGKVIAELHQRRKDRPQLMTCGWVNLDATVFDQCGRRVTTDRASQAEKQMGVDHTQVVVRVLFYSFELISNMSYLLQ